MQELTLARYEAQGNDFLIALLDQRGLRDLDASLCALSLDRGDLARVVCDRALGVVSRLNYTGHSTGADGFIVGVHNASGSESAACVRMHLLNADGSFAETSGNGLASLAFAALDAGLVPDGSICFETDAGKQRCTIDPANAASGNRTGVEAHHVSVEMNSVAKGRPSMPSELKERIPADFGEDLRCFETGSVGNPHLVIALANPIYAARAAELGAAYARLFADGINVEFIWPAHNEGVDCDLVMGVWERGVGLTHSCGTGSVVAATLAQHWEIVPNKAIVRMATVPRGWEFGEKRGDARSFVYRVRTSPSLQLLVMAEKVETGITQRLDEIPKLLKDFDTSRAVRP